MTQVSATTQNGENQLNENAVEEDLVNDETTDLVENENTEVSNEIDKTQDVSLEKKETRSQGVAIDANNFPDDDFRAFIASSFDKDKNRYLSQTEIDAVQTIWCSRSSIKSLEGIKIFKNLEDLRCSANEISKIDVSGMQKLTYVDYNSNKGLKTLDFRNCPNLVAAYHSINDEVVYISAGMTKYEGCQYVPGHTGNIVIDLNVYYTTNTDGSKTVDLSEVISQYLIDVLAKEDNPAFDKDTNILTIPAGEGKTEIEAGHNNFNDPFTWTFYTSINAVDDVVVTFDTNGRSVVEAATISKGSTVAQPKAPTKDGYDFATVVNSDLTLYAKWTAKTPVEPTLPETPAQGEGEVLGVTEAPKVVKTADNTHITLYMMVLFLAGSVAIKTVSYKKKENKE